MRSRSLSVSAVARLLPLVLAMAACSGTGSTVGDGGVDATGDALPSSDSPSNGDVADNRDAPAESAADAGAEGGSLDSATDGAPEGATDAPVEGAADTGPTPEAGADVGSVDASEGGGPDVVVLDAPVETGSPDAALCPVMQPLNGGKCAISGLMCDYGPLPKAGAICTCEAKTHTWHCLFV